MNAESLINFYQKNKLVIFSGIVVVSSLILIIFVIYPQISKLIINQKDEQQIINKTKFLDDKALALKNYDKTDLDRKVSLTLNSYLPNKDFISAFSIMQNIISQSGFTTLAIGLGSSSFKMANTDSYDIKMEIIGPSLLVPVLLSNIESSSRLMRVGNIEITAGTNPQIVNLALNVHILFSPTPSNFGSIESPIQELSQKDQDLLARLADAVNSTAATQSATQAVVRGKPNPFQ